MDYNTEKDRLDTIYSAMKLDSPSMSFENNLMQRIYKHQQLVERRRSRFTLVVMLLGAVSVVIVPLIVLHLLGWSVVGSTKETKDAFMDVVYSINNGSLVLSVSFVCLFLMLMDSIIRRYIYKKENK